MTVEQLINKLHGFNPDAEVKVIAHCKVEDFTLVWGGEDEGEGGTKLNTSQVSFYVDRLCGNDQQT